MRTVVVSISMPLEMLEALDKMAISNYQYRSELIRRAVREFLRTENIRINKAQQFETYFDDLVKGKNPDPIDLG